MQVCLDRVTQGAIGHGQRIVDRRGLRINRERAFQILRGLGIVTPGQRDAPRTEHRGRGLRLIRDGALKRSLRLIEPVVAQVRLTAPDQRVQIVRFYLQRSFKRRGRTDALAGSETGVARIVRPALVVWREGLGARKTGSGLAAESGSHEDPAERTVRGGLLGARRTRARKRLLQLRIATANLLPNRRG